MVRNLILNALDPHEFSFLSRHLKFVPLKVGQVLCEPYAPIRNAWFLAGGMACTFTTMKDGLMVASNITGREGFLPVPIILGSDRMPSTSTAMVVEGCAFSIEASFLRSHIRELGLLKTILDRYVTVQMIQLAQNAACCQLHYLEERLACWLLMISDRVGGEFKITHEVIAAMLGSRRATITLHAEKMQRAGMIQYTYGRVQIVNRARLEHIACECYEIHRQAYENFVKSKFL
jgi:CRP-like cAMP-binding protein